MDLQILRGALGGEISGRQLICPGPGHSPKDRSLAITVVAGAPDGFICHSHAGDDWRDCRDYVRARLGLPAWQPGDEQDRRVPREHLRAYDIGNIDREDERQPDSDEERERIARAVRIWDEGVDPRTTLAEKYLNKQRMLELPHDICGNVLRFHQACPWRDENTGRTIFIPALIAAFKSIDTDEITAVHRIALRPDSTKVGRRMLGITRRAAIKLNAATDALMIGEGVETCMAAGELGFSPTWALGSVGAISFFPVIDNVEVLTILGEAGAASEEATKICVRRWLGAGRRVRVVTPDPGCSDMNDELVIQKQRGTAA